jgi:acyl carrier protein
MSEALIDRVLKVLVSVAPDVDPSAVAIDVNLRDQFDFDSMDTLHFAIGLKRELGVDIPDTEFRELASIGRCVKYLQKRLGSSA